MTGPAPAQARRAALDARERAILDAAAEVFAASGREGARMAEIARRAGISEGAVYLHFRGKAELMAALAARFWEELEAEARAATAAAEGPGAKLRALAAFHLAAVTERLDYMRLALSPPSDREVEAEAGVAWKRRYVAVFDEIVRGARAEGAEEPPLWVLRDVFYGGLEYAARSVRLRPGRAQAPAAEAAARAVEALSAAAAPPAEGAERRLERAARRLERAAERLERASG